MFKIDFNVYTNAYLTSILAEKHKEFNDIKNHEYLRNDVKESLMDGLTADIESINSVLLKRESDKSCRQLE